MVYKLKRNTIRSILDYPKAEQGKSHLLQIYDIKTSAAGTPKERRTMRFSDGIQFIRGVVNKRTPATNFDIIEMTNFRLADLKGSNILMIDDFTVIFTEISVIIGNPVECSKENILCKEIVLTIPKTAKRLVDIRITEESPTDSTSDGSSYHGMVCAINELNSSVSNWAINVRITKKGIQRKFGKGQQEGTLLPIELVDEKGTQITATLFGEAIEKHKHLIIEGKCIQISGGIIKGANKRYTSIKSEISLSLDSQSSIIAIPEISTIPKNAFSFNGSMVDVIGVVRDLAPAKSVHYRDGNDISKRTFSLFDELGKCVEVTLWRSIAELNYKEDQIVAFKNIRVGEYNHIKQLSTITDTVAFFNVRNERVQLLEDWKKSHPPFNHEKTVPRPHYELTVVFGRVVKECSGCPSGCKREIVCNNNFYNFFS